MKKGHRFTEDVDYSKTGVVSIWGTGDKDTLELLGRISIRGKWLNLAAGDGRYNPILLKKADFVVASDIDEGALEKLLRTTPEGYKSKVQTRLFDITKRFPFEDGTFDGVFCTGTLHFFSKDTLEGIFSEINRVLRPGGKVIIDFATDVKRILPDGSAYAKRGEPGYGLEEATNFLRDIFRDYNVELYKSEVKEEDVKISGTLAYKFSCKFILLVGEKK